MIREKRFGKIKGHACADGSKQGNYILKEEIASPTVQFESFDIAIAYRFTRRNGCHDHGCSQCVSTGRYGRLCISENNWKICGHNVQGKWVVQETRYRRQW